MPSIFDGLNIGTSGLYAAQTAINVTGDNVANANTPGYTRETAVFVPSYPQFTPEGEYGSGVNVTSIISARDNIIDRSLRENYTQQSYYEQLDTTFKQIQSLFNETQNVGLSSALQQFFSSWQTLSQNPDLETARQQVINSGKTLVNTIKYSYNSLYHIQESLDKQVASIVEEINTYAKEIANLNKQIKEGGLGPNQPANTLIDQRSVLIDKLSKLANITVLNTQGNNTSPSSNITILLGGMPIVSDTTYDTISVQKPEGSHFNDIYFDYPSGKTVDITNKIISGKLGAVLKERDGFIEDYKDKLNEIASALIQSVNKIHSAGTGLTPYSQVVGTYYLKNAEVPLSEDSLTGLNMSVKTGSFKVLVTDSEGNKVGTFSVAVNANDTFEDIKERFNNVLKGYAYMGVSAGNQGNIQITSEGGYRISFTYDSSHFLAAAGINAFFSGSSAADIAVNKIVESDPSKIAAGTTLTPGDGSNAQAIASVQMAHVMVNNTQTINQYYDAFLGTIGSEAGSVKSILDSKNAIIQQIKNQQQSEEGVSLNEEAANLIKLQTAYAASAKYIGVINQLTQDLVGMIK